MDKGKAEKGASKLMVMVIRNEQRMNQAVKIAVLLSDELSSIQQEYPGIPLTAALAFTESLRTFAEVVRSDLEKCSCVIMESAIQKANEARCEPPLLTDEVFSDRGKAWTEAGRQEYGGDENG